MLEIFDVLGGHEWFDKKHINQQSGCHGIGFGVKNLTVIDAMIVSFEVWNNHEKYVTKYFVIFFWRKATIIPVLVDE